MKILVSLAVVLATWASSAAAAQKLECQNESQQAYRVVFDWSGSKSVGKVAPIWETVDEVWLTYWEGDKAQGKERVKLLTWKQGSRNSERNGLLFFSLVDHPGTTLELNEDVRAPGVEMGHGPIRGTMRLLGEAIKLSCELKR